MDIVFLPKSKYELPHRHGMEGSCMTHGELTVHEKQLLGIVGAVDENSKIIVFLF